MPPSLEPGLYIVATPIGNLSDLSPRAADTLRGAALVLAEDKRVTAKLLRHIGATAPMRVYNDYSSEADRAEVLERIGREAVALVSDAGTPLISDPGFKLVREARRQGLSIHTIPGPCAAIAALTLAGLPTDRFLFAGFLPAKAKARSESIAELGAVRATLVLFESGPRLAESLGALASGLGDREGAVVREISKLYEEVAFAPLTDLAERYVNAPPKGEIVIVVGPPPERAAASDDDLDSALIAAMREASASRAAAAVAEMLGIPRKRAYARALELGAES